MAQSQRVIFENRPASYTVVGQDQLPIAPAREYLRFLGDNGASPNTVRSYSQGLAAWWTVLEHSEDAWDDFPTSLFGHFLSYLRTGDLPGAQRIGAPVRWLAESSVQPRAAAVLSMYRYHADANNLDRPYERLFTWRGKRGRSRYSHFLDGIGPRRESARPIYTIRSGPASTTPVLLPRHVDLILDACSVQHAGDWSGSAAALRNRLLFAVLAETGMRLGEALSLRHNDFHIGAGGTPWVEVVPRQDHPHGLRVKSARSRRIFVGDDLEALYSAYVWQLIDQSADTAVKDLATHFVFVNLAQGTRFAPMRVETVYAKTRAITRHHSSELPEGWSPHWLRHTHATALLLAGVQPHVVMRRLGHADVQTTLSTYGWVTEEAEMRSLAEWRSFVAGWKGLHDGVQ